MERHEVAENNMFIMEKKQSDEVNISLSNSGKKQKWIYILPWIPLFFLQLDSK